MPGFHNGIVIGIVADLEDPEKLGRVKVKFPCLDNQESYWARLVSLMAGPDRGVFFRPEVNDEVLVALEHGDYRRPYILGALWNKQDKPPADDGKAKANNWRLIKSRSGHIIKLDDTPGAEKIEILDKSGKNMAIFDTAKNTITISATDTVRVEAPKIEVNGQSSVKVEAPTVEVTGKTSVKVEAPQIEMKAQAQMTIDGGGMLTLRGGLVKIN